MYKKQIEQLFAEMHDKLNILIYHHGEPSEFTGNKCLKVDEECAFNLGSSLWIHEVNDSSFMCYIGNEYPFNSITFEQFGELIDHLIEKYS